MPVLLLGLDLMSGCRHCQVARLRQDVDCPGNLFVVRIDWPPVGRHSAVSGDYNVEAQLKFYKRSIVINDRREILKGWTLGYKFLESLESTI